MAGSERKRRPWLAWDGKGRSTEMEKQRAWAQVSLALSTCWPHPLPLSFPSSPQWLPTPPTHPLSPAPGVFALFPLPFHSSLNSNVISSESPSFPLPSFPLTLHQLSRCLPLTLKSIKKKMGWWMGWRTGRGESKYNKTLMVESRWWVYEGSL